MINSNKLHETLYVALRASSLGSKLLLIIFINKYFSLSDIVTYNYIIFAVIYTVYFSNFEIGSVITKRAFGSKGQLHLLRPYLCFFIISSVVFSIILFFIINEKYSSQLSIYCVLFFIMEYWNKEIERLLFLIDNKLSAAINLFIRSGISSLLSIVIMYYFKADIYTVMFVMIVSGGASLLLGMCNISSLYKSIKTRTKVSSSIYIKIMKESLFLFMSLIALKTFFYIDKEIIVQLSNDKIKSAAYFLFYSFSFLILTFNEIILFSRTFPKLLTRTNRENIKDEFIALIKKVVFCSFVIGLVINASIAVVLIITDKTIYFDYIEVLLIQMLTIISYSIIQVQRYYLFINDETKSILTNNIVILISMVAAVYTLYSCNKVDIITSVALSSAISMLLGLVIYSKKFIYYVES